GFAILHHPRDGYRLHHRKHQVSTIQWKYHPLRRARALSALSCVYAPYRNQRIMRGPPRSHWVCQNEQGVVPAPILLLYPSYTHGRASSDCTYLPLFPVRPYWIGPKPDKCENWNLRLLKYEKFECGPVR